MKASDGTASPEPSWSRQPGFPPGHWYSPNADPAALVRRRHVLWPDTPQETAIDFRPGAQRAFILGPLRRFHEQYGRLLARSAREPLPFTEPNDFFMGLDSLVLHTMLCELKPARILEVGSGYSTRLLASVNRHELGSRAEIVSIDPYASEELRKGGPGLTRLICGPVQEVPLEWFDRLARNDILFVDSTHVIKTGSDVEFLLCRVLPRLTAGVVVHFHDIYLPFEYPYEWVVTQRRDWNEQYAVHAVLASADCYEVMFGSRFARWALAEDLVSVLGNVPGGQSLWLRVGEAPVRGDRGDAQTAAAAAASAPAPVPADARSASPHVAAYDPDLVPPPALMRTEGIDVLEEWFRWGEEWSMLLRCHAGLGVRSRVLEIGCGLGRTAFALRYLLRAGSYEGFDIVAEKIRFLQGFTARYPNFRFVHADLRNTEYNPRGRLDPADFIFPYPDATFDIVYAASVFTHLLPERALHYFREIARVLARGGRALVSVFVLDWYEPGRPRPLGFDRPAFDFRHPVHGHAGVAVSNPANPEGMIAFSLEALAGMTSTAGLRLGREPLPGVWSGGHGAPIGAQDVLILELDH